jgi:hypothetical protein
VPRLRRFHLGPKLRLGPHFPEALLQFRRGLTANRITWTLSGGCLRSPTYLKPSLVDGRPEAVKIKSLKILGILAPCFRLAVLILTRMTLVTSVR